MSASRLAAALRSLRVFAGLPPGQLELLAQHAALRSHAAGEIILRDQEQASGLFVLLSGQVKLYRVSAEGREQTLALYGPGEPFCPCLAFEESKAPAFVAALEASQSALFTGAAFERMLRAEPSILFNLVRVLASRLKEAMDLVEALSLREIPGRVATYLLRAAGRSESFTLPMTQRELAKIVGATPEALSRAFGRMAGAGLAQVKGRTVRILDRPALERAAQGLDG
jgi:CRP/FNR family transcriptional regulator, dissimilatory nitrate respiration regulator